MTISVSERPATRPGRSAAPWPAPGAFLERGRYRLVCQVGRDERCAAQWWRGYDLVLERDVALTLLLPGPEDRSPQAQVRPLVQRALRSARLVTVGAAQVLDVLDPDHRQLPVPAEPFYSGPAVAAVVAEWTPGPHLLTLMRDNHLPPPSVAAGMLAPLAGAVDAAHRAGLVLGCDQPHRIRIGPDGRARVAFAGPPLDTSPQDDIRGLGALLYLLLTGYWPLPDPPGQLPPAPIGPDGALASPRALRPEVPTELSRLALRCLAGSDAAGVHTGAAVHQVLKYHTTTPDQATLLPATTGQQTTPRDSGHARTPHPARLAISVTTLIGALLLILGYTGIQTASIVSDTPSNPPPVVIVGAPATQPAHQPAPAPALAPAPIAAQAVHHQHPAGSHTHTRTQHRAPAPCQNCDTQSLTWSALAIPSPSTPRPDRGDRLSGCGPPRPTAGLRDPGTLPTRGHCW
jgi:hypothetical protein